MPASFRAMVKRQVFWRGGWLLGVCSAAGVLATAAAVAAPSHGERSTVVVRVDGGFHWLDAGIGAVAAFAVVLLAYGLTLSVGHSKGRRGT